jgi:hypothetical protein
MPLTDNIRAHPIASIAFNAIAGLKGKILNAPTVALATGFCSYRPTMQQKNCPLQISKLAMGNLKKTSFPPSPPETRGTSTANQFEARQTRFDQNI